MTRYVVPLSRLSGKADFFIQRPPPIKLGPLRRGHFFDGRTACNEADVRVIRAFGIGRLEQIFSHWRKFANGLIAVVETRQWFKTKRGDRRAGMSRVQAGDREAPCQIERAGKQGRSQAAH